MKVPPSGPPSAKIMIVGEAPGEREVAQGEPFVGASGAELTRMLHEAGIARSTCFITNVARERPPGNDISAFIPSRKKDITHEHTLFRGKMVTRHIVDGVALLKREISLVQPNVIIALGNTALWVLTGEWGIRSWRSSVLEADLVDELPYRPKVIPTYHPAAILRQWSDRQVAVHDLRRAAREALTRERTLPDYRFTIRPSIEAVFERLAALKAEADDGDLQIAVDIETKAGHIDCLGIAWSPTEALCIPFMSATDTSGYWSAEQESLIVLCLYRLLTHPRTQVLGQNFLYDAQYIHRWWHFIPRLTWDTMLAHHSMFSNSRKSLDFLASIYAERYIYWKDENQEADARIPEEQRWTYNCKDCCYTYEIAAAQEAAAFDLTATWLALPAVMQFQQDLFWPVLQAMNRGIRFDHARKADFAAHLREEIARRDEWITQACGHALNTRSPHQMKRFFYEDLRQKPIISRKTGTPTLDDEALGRIAVREPLLRPLIRRIQELRSLNVFLSTFISAPVDIDGRMRCSFNIAGTETFRFSSSTNAFGTGLNLQNIPKGGEEEELELPNVRTLFIPDASMTFFDIDLSSADLRIVVWEADEPELKAMLAEGLDPYTEIAKEFYHDPSITKKDPRRQTFKSFAHGTNYLGTARGLAQRLGLSVADAERTQHWYFSRFPRIKKWQDDLKAQVTSRRYVENVFGYRWFCFDRVEGTIFNQAAAWIPQSTVACLINRGFVNIHRNLPEVEVLLQVHDSLAGQFPSSLGEWAVQRIVEECSIPLPYADPCIIPVGIKTSTTSWGDCE